MHTKGLIAVGSVCGALAVSACDLDVPDLNNPAIDDLENHPTAISIGVASTGLLIGNRTGHGAEIGYVSQTGILGRESYCFDSADPRFITELLERSPMPSGSPFGGGFWLASYQNVRLANIILHAVSKVDLPDADKHAIVGFAKTMQALDLLKQVSLRDTNGVVVDTDHDATAAPPPLVDKATALTAIAKLLDDALPELDQAGDAFPFLLDDGFSGFETPKTTFKSFNRAIKARVAVYQKDYTEALKALDVSFIVDGDATIDFDLGVFYTFTTKGGDTTNGLANPNIYVHPSVSADAQAGDKRLERKVGPAAQPGQARGLSSTQAFKLYPKPTSSIALIRNEELILLKAEALWFAPVSGTPAGDKVKALAELNLVRVNQGGLAKITTPPVDEAAFTTALLYERRYSLLFEGHRLIDLRRFDRTMDLPLDKDTHKRNIRYPIPLAECNARPSDEPRCKLGSS
jgi:hypothetical protein